VRHLACAAGAFDHGGLCGAAIHHEGAAECGCGIGRGEANEVGVFVDLLMMPRGVYARCGGALRNDHDKTRAGDRKQRFHVSSTEFGPAQVRKATGYRAENGDTRLGPVKNGARRDCPGNGKERPWQPGCKKLEGKNTRYNRE